MLKQIPSLEELQATKVAFIEAFQDWIAIPFALFEKSRVQSPEVLILKDYWAKLAQDFSAVLLLIETNHTGSALVLLRSCRETALRMVCVAFVSTQESTSIVESERNRRSTTAKRLKKDIEGLIHKWPDRLNDDTLDQLKSVVGNTSSMIEENLAANDQGSHGFKGLVNLAVEALSGYGITPDGLALQVRDYWLESEAVHCGPDSAALYFPHPFECEDARRSELTSLMRACDLSFIKSFAIASILRVTKLQGNVPEPEISVRLRRLARNISHLVDVAKS